MFHSSPEGHLDRRGESGQDHEKRRPWSNDLAELKAEVRTEDGLSEHNVRLEIYHLYRVSAWQRTGERFGAVNSPLSLYITLLIYLNEHLV